MSEKRTFDLVALSASKYHQRALLEELTPGKEYIRYGEDNLFPQYLISLMASSPVHSALVTSIASMIYGKGVSCSDEEMAKDMRLDSVMRKTAIDLKLQGGFYWEIYWSPEADRIVKIEHTPFERWRSGQMDEDGKVHKYYYCIDWSKEREFPVTEWDAFNPITATGSEVQVLCVKPFSVGSFYYPKPDYIGAVNWIEVDKNVSIFHNNNIQNGLHPGFSIHWKNGIPPIEERNQIRAEIEKQLGGAENAGRFWMTFSDSPEQAPDIRPFEVSNLSEQFQFISAESTDKMMIGHRVTSPILFGVKTAGQLSGASELEQAKRIFNKDVIEPFQRVINEALEEIQPWLGIEYIAIENEQADQEANVDGSFGAEQVNSAVGVLDNVRNGVITPKQGRVLLQSLLNFTEAAALEVLPEPIRMHSHKHDMSDEDGAAWLSYLDGKGEKMSEDYELVHEGEVGDEVDEYRLHMSDVHKVNLFKRFANPDERSEIDTGLYKIRYRYSQNLSDNSRLFCRNMVANSKSGVSYRFEDIESMAGEVNTQFAPSGENSYSIWLYKGGAYCHHRWVRQVWMRKREGGRFLPNDGLSNDKRVSVADAERAGVPFKDDTRGFDAASTAPINTPSRGKLN